VSNYQLSINNYQLPEGYKQTEVGVIPESWEVIPITKATNEIFLGLTARVDYVESGGIPLVRATDIAKGKLSFDKARTISIQQHKKLTKYRRAKRGDVLVSKSGSLGVCAIVDTDQEFSIYESIIVLQANSSLDSKFLRIFLTIILGISMSNEIVFSTNSSWFFNITISLFKINQIYFCLIFFLLIYHSLQISLSFYWQDFLNVFFFDFQNH
jgi:hypothetical protein